MLDVSDFITSAVSPNKGLLMTTLAIKLGTPFWLYDASIVRRQIKRLQGFDIIRYAQKANGNINLLKIIRRNGVKIDAVSNGEIARALAAGYRAGSNDLVFVSDVFDQTTLKQVVELCIPVNCGSTDMIDQLAMLSPGHQIWLRINPGFGHGHSKKTNTGGPLSKHGIWHEQLSELGRKIKSSKLNLVGLHMHIGSDVDYKHLGKVCNAMIEAYMKLGMQIRAVSAGGGLSIPYHSDCKNVAIDYYAQQWNVARLKIQDSQTIPVQIEIEPGRFLVAEAGYLIAEVRAVKKVAERYFVIVDAGFNDLVRPAMYGSYHHICFIDPAANLVIGALHQVAVAGPLCEAGDVFTQNKDGTIEFKNLPLPKIGDFCIFADAGAYGSTMSSNYNSRPLIPEVIVDGSDIRLVRRRQTIKEMLSLENDDHLLEN
ncbi:diaminopimelate decarboxylase [Candidatus Endolissoclinum faulkneri L2]|uniref:Diaminopimelate decarboxylase n=1 Tax=Candidatus Endolissoclinum faulkneri L2 TaxID=1193729 RepID=K7ZC21_9PROT|nr:diaminopimelate decarboxylase [Candidatus Endolissoclinum faulkneri]AFX98221.1 diaminopimelate decarboxylase [Candidatus Endolissoclinum faulkneri L2]